MRLLLLLCTQHQQKHSLDNSNSSSKVRGLEGHRTAISRVHTAHAVANEQQTVWEDRRQKKKEKEKEKTATNRL